MKFLRNLYFKSEVQLSDNEQAFPTGHVKPRISVMFPSVQSSYDYCTVFGHIWALFLAFLLQRFCLTALSTIVLTLWRSDMETVYLA